MKTPFDKKVPDKLYFKIGEVSDIADIPAYVLRFWETEFRNINPKRSPSGQRMYRKSDVELILNIKHLLYDKKFTIQGAKQYLKAEKKRPERKSRALTMVEVRAELNKIRQLLD